MKKRNIVIIVMLILLSNFVVYVLTINMKIINDKEYETIGLELQNYNVEYCKNYSFDDEMKYKVYKIKKDYTGSIDYIEDKLKDNENWNKEKYYEYVMNDFYDVDEQENKKDLDRENLYYYHNKDAYAIFDLKNAKLYYYEPGWWRYDFNQYNTVFDIDIRTPIEQEVYSVKANNMQGDGIEYYVYKFTEEKGKEIEENIETNDKWTAEKLSDDKLDYLEYNEEVKNIKNGYYHYGLVCRTSDKYKKEHCTEEEATGCEIGVYDVENNIMYYFWETT